MSIKIPNVMNQPRCELEIVLHRREEEGMICVNIAVKEVLAQLPPPPSHLLLSA